MGVWRGEPRDLVPMLVEIGVGREPRVDDGDANAAPRGALAEGRGQPVCGRRAGQLSDVPGKMKAEVVRNGWCLWNGELWRRYNSNEQRPVNPVGRRLGRVGRQDDCLHGVCRITFRRRSNHVGQRAGEFFLEQIDRTSSGDNGTWKVEHLEAEASQLMFHMRQRALGGRVLTESAQSEPVEQFVEGDSGLRSSDYREGNEVVRRSRDKLFKLLCHRPFGAHGEISIWWPCQDEADV